MSTSRSFPPTYCYTQKRRLHLLGIPLVDERIVTEVADCRQWFQLENQGRSFLLLMEVAPLKNTYRQPTQAPWF